MLDHWIWNCCLLKPFDLSYLMIQTSGDIYFNFFFIFSVTSTEFSHSLVVMLQSLKVHHKKRLMKQFQRLMPCFMRWIWWPFLIICILNLHLHCCMILRKSWKCTEWEGTFESSNRDCLLHALSRYMRKKHLIIFFEFLPSNTNAWVAWAIPLVDMGTLILITNQIELFLCGNYKLHEYLRIYLDFHRGQ